jgi:ankyrin repeat protein
MDEDKYKLLTACKDGDEKQLAELLKDPNINIDDVYICGETLLYTACFYGHIDVVQLLLDYGANINKFDAISITPLATAVHNGHYNVVKLLLNNGADMKIPTTSGFTIQEFLKRKGSQEMKDLIESYLDTPIKEPDH